MSSSRGRAVAITLAKAAVSVGLIAFALRGTDFSTVVAQLRSADPVATAAAAIVTLLISLLHAHRWGLVLRALGKPLAYADALRLTLIGYLFNQTLPSTVGGDAYRVWGAYGRGVPTGVAITSVIVDRFFALLSLVGILALGSWWLLQWITAPVARVAVVTVVAGAIASLVACFWITRFAPTLRRWRLGAAIADLAAGVRTVAVHPATALHVLLVSLAGHVAISFAVYLMAKGLAINLGLGHALLFIPLVTLVTVLPISIAGWGLRESAMVVSLGLVGVPQVQAVSLSILYGLIVMSTGIPGGVLWLSVRGSPTRNEAPP